MKEKGVEIPHDNYPEGWRSYRVLLMQLYLLIPLFFLLLIVSKWIDIHPAYFIAGYIGYAVWLLVSVRRYPCPRCKKIKNGLFSGPAWLPRRCKHCGLEKGVLKT